MFGVLSRCAFAVGVVLATACAAPQSVEPTSPRPSDGLSATEQAQLLNGDHVVRERVFERGDGRYVGGVAYQIVDATPDAVLSAVRDADSLREMLPHTKSVTELGSPGSGRFEVHQGNDLAEAQYTVVLEDVPGEDEVRFYLDDSAPHDIKDVYGYFRATPAGQDRTLVTVGVALDLGPGLVRMLFERRIQQVMLTMPQRVRDFMEGDRVRGLVARTDDAYHGAPY